MSAKAAFTGFFLIGLLVWQTAASAAEPPAEQLDCRVHDTEKSKIGVALKVASFLFKWGPEISYDKERGIAWDKVVQGFIAKYKELCSRYNAGLVTKAEYEARLREMEGLHREAMALERKMVDETRGRAKAGVEELDRTLAQRRGDEAPQADPIKASLEDLGQRIDKLEPIGRPLIPKPPCPPPDMLGAPGRSC